MLETEVCSISKLHFTPNFQIICLVWIIGHVLSGWDGTNPLLNPSDLCEFYTLSLYDNSLRTACSFGQFTKCTYISGCHQLVLILLDIVWTDFLPTLLRVRLCTAFGRNSAYF